MTNFRIQITSKAQKDLKKLHPAIRKRITTAILSLEISRYPRQSKYLKGDAIAQFRLRVGGYRVLYDVYDDDAVVLILRIGHRKDIYR